MAAPRPAAPEATAATSEATVAPPPTAPVVEAPAVVPAPVEPQIAAEAVAPGATAPLPAVHTRETPEVITRVNANSDFDELVPGYWEEHDVESSPDESGRTHAINVRTHHPVRKPE